MLVDHARIHVAAGNGGRRMRELPPGEVRAEGRTRRGRRRQGRQRRARGRSQRVRTLLDCRERLDTVPTPVARARGTTARAGRRGPRRSRCPPGTVVKDADTRRGARRSRGARRRAGSPRAAAGAGAATRASRRRRTRRRGAPSRASRARSAWLELELKLIADVGLVGLPNAGKSTLLVAHHARPAAIADVSVHDARAQPRDRRARRRAPVRRGRSPRPHRGCARGKGLGHEFLRHVERTRVLAFLVDVTSESPARGSRR